MPRALPPLCPSCGKRLRAKENFCESCGEAVSEELKQEVESHRRSHPSRRGRMHVREAKLFAQRVRNSARILLVIAALFVLGGTIEGYAALDGQEQFEQAVRAAGLDDDVELGASINGEWYTVGEAREVVALRVRLTFAINYGLAVLMIGLFFWARRSPVGAMMIALCLFLAVLGLAALVDPSTLLQGVVVKALIVVALIVGMRTAFAERAFRERYGARAADDGT